MSKVLTLRVDKSNIKLANQHFIPGGNMSTTNIEKEVLFQKLGNTWFIITEINDEVVYSTLPQGMDPHSTKLELYEVIEEHMHKVAKNKQLTKSA